MGSMTASPSSRRPRIAVLVVPAVVVSFGGAFALGAAQQPMIAAAVAFAGALVAVAASARLGRAPGVLVSVLVLCMAAAGGSVGKAWLRTEIRRELPLLRAVVSAPRGSLHILEVPGSKRFRQGFVAPDPQGGFRVRFPLEDGSVVEFVSNSELWDREERCSEELARGRYRRYRCS